MLDGHDHALEGARARVGARRGRRRRLRRRGAHARGPARLRQRAEVAKQPLAELGLDRFGVKLDAPVRPVAVAHRHHRARGRARRHLELCRQWLVRRERVVAHREEVLGEAREQLGAVVLDAAATPVHRLGRRPDGAPVGHHQSLVAEADAQQRQIVDLERPGGEAEVARAVRTARAGGDHDLGEALDVDLGPVDLVVAHDDRLHPLDQPQQLKEVEGVGVVVVDQEGRHRRRAAGGPYCKRCTAACRPRPTARGATILLMAQPLAQIEFPAPPHPDPALGVFETLLVVRGSRARDPAPPRAPGKQPARALRGRAAAVAARADRRRRARAFARAHACGRRSRRRRGAGRRDPRRVTRDGAGRARGRTRAGCRRRRGRLRGAQAGGPPLAGGDRGGRRRGRARALGHRARGSCSRPRARTSSCCAAA